MCTDTRRVFTYRQAGISLIETMIFIVVMGVGITGLLGVMNHTIKHSADPMLQKQAQAIAESLLEEIMLQPFTDCDPAAYNFNTGVCSQIETMGPETISGTLQTRYNANASFNNVNDYNGFAMASGIHSITDGTTVISGLGSYLAAVRISDASTELPSVAAGNALRITVQVIAPTGGTVTLDGYRLKYAPIPQ
jgi:MSHA pilin protein MshD